MHTLNLKVSLKKCNFGQKELLALAHKVSGLSLAIDQNKVAEVLQKPVSNNNKEMKLLLWFPSYYKSRIKNCSHIAGSLYKLCSKDVVFEITKERRDAYEKIKHELTLPDFELPFNLYIDAAGIQGLGAALHQRKIVDGDPREGVIFCISWKWKDSEARYGATQSECLFFEVYTDCTAFKSLLNMKTTNGHMLRWQISIEEYRAKIPIHFKEIDRRQNFRFSEWTPESGTPDSEDTYSEGTETPILGISSSELNNELFSAVIKIYGKHKQCGILLQLLQQKYKSPELESQLEEPWLRDYKDNKF
ncbi:hypothetical protein O181_058330 [Austropuccinia psidii MF-1]|uniref:Reverse transcriptase RNase H-like domain-containing protein n=1 Tax=Austropuccinia psidii MF-1 TaxID=1389203 RepID=A0A9Q3EGA7_9BASI|nr:hypothetical protein [Austropuccinia psidii MF-1]